MTLNYNKTMKKYYYILIIFSLAITSCEITPNAFFYSDKVNVQIGEKVFFTNDSYNADEFEWDFGDGTYSSAVNPVHTYNSSGTFEVILTAYARMGNSDKAYQTIDVVIPTTLEIEVLEYYDKYPVKNASVILYSTLRDWDAETNMILEGFTNSSGKVVFTNMDVDDYFVDVWESNHNNYTLRDEDVSFIRTQKLLPNEINRFVAWVDYVSASKGDSSRDRTMKIRKLERKASEKIR
jgi:PKD repeat protein